MPLHPALAPPLLALALLATPSAGARQDDHERARAAVARGEALPLEQILRGLPLRPGERLLEVEFEREDGRWVYEIELIGPDGRVRELEVDALTGEVLEED